MAQQEKIPNELQNALPENCSKTVHRRNAISQLLADQRETVDKLLFHFPATFWYISFPSIPCSRSRLRASTCSSGGAAAIEIAAPVPAVVAGLAAAFTVAHADVAVAAARPVPAPDPSHSVAVSLLLLLFETMVNDRSVWTRLHVVSVWEKKCGEKVCVRHATCGV